MTTVTVSFDNRNSLALNLFNAMKLSGLFRISENIKSKKLCPVEVSLQESQKGKINQYDSIDGFFKKIL